MCNSFPSIDYEYIVETMERDLELLQNNVILGQGLRIFPKVSGLGQTSVDMLLEPG